jgi:hypothetical protein
VARRRGFIILGIFRDIRDIKGYLGTNLRDIKGYLGIFGDVTNDCSGVI